MEILCNSQDASYPIPSKDITPLRQLFASSNYSCLKDPDQPSKLDPLCLLTIARSLCGGVHLGSASPGFPLHGVVGTHPSSLVSKQGSWDAERKAELTKD